VTTKTVEETPAGAAVATGRFTGGRDIASLTRDYGIIVAFVGMFFVLAITTPNFMTSQNLENVVNQNAYMGIAACGATFVIIAGGFDLSVGAIYALAGAIAAYVTIHVDPVLGLLAGAAVGPALGVFNGVLVSGVGIHSFLATLGSSLAFGGLAVAVTSGFLIDASNETTFVWLGRGTPILGLPNPVVIFVVVALALGFVLSRTRFGRYVYAVGGNIEAARLSGIRVGSIHVSAYVISGVCSALAGLILASRAGSAQSTMATGSELTAIAAAVIGGTSILGGEGAIWRGVVGAFLLTLIGNGFNLLGWDTIYQQVLQGCLILFAVTTDRWLRRRSR
jgi:ribose transport system permease protein